MGKCGRFWGFFFTTHMLCSIIMCIIIVGGIVMASTNVTVRLDEDIKKEFDLFCENVGITITTAFNMFIRATLRTRELPFSITDNNAQLTREDYTAKLADILALGKIPTVELSLDDNGHLAVDPLENPEIYDWLVNG